MKHRLFLLTLAFLLVCQKPQSTAQNGTLDRSIPDDSLPLDDTQNSPASSYKIAFIGDSGKSDGFQKTLSLIDRENVDLVLHLGDLAYSEFDRHSPRKWDAMIDSTLGPSFPYIFVIGNHDRWHWGGSKGFRSILKRRINNLPNGACSAKDNDEDHLGIKSYCKLPGILMLLSGIGTKEDDHETYMEEVLARNQSTPWKICAWHKNQRDMQVGTKRDEVGWDAYQICARHGAMIMTGHEHSYSRTRTLTQIGHRDQHHGVTGSYKSLQVGPERTFVVVSGLGGKSARPYNCRLHDQDTWWASIYSANYILNNGKTIEEKQCDSVAESLKEPRTGVLFIEFNYNGNAKLAKGRFVSSEGDVFDEFWINR